VSGQQHGPAALYPGKDPVPIVQEAGWVTGPVWTGGKSRTHRDSIPDRPARSTVAIPTELPGPHNIIIYYIYRVLVGKPVGKRPLGRPRRRWVDNIRMNLQEVGCGYMDWIGLAQDRDRWRTLVSTVMNLRVPRNAGNFLTSCKPVSFSRRTLHHGVSITILYIYYIFYIYYDIYII